MQTDSQVLELLMLTLEPRPILGGWLFLATGRRRQESHCHDLSIIDIA